MTINKLFTKWFVIAALFAVCTTITSCQKDDIDNPEPNPEQPQPESKYRPGDDFRSYANAERLAALEGADPEGYYGWFKDISNVNNPKLAAIKNEMSEYKALREALTKLEANYETSTALVDAVVEALVDNIETKEDAYLAYGAAIRLGIKEAGNIHVAVCYDDNTLGYFIRPSFALKMISDADPSNSESDTASHDMFHTPKVELLARYSSGTRSNSAIVEFILEGVGLDPEHYLHKVEYDAAFAALEQLSIEEWIEAISDIVRNCLLKYRSDADVEELSEGKYKSVANYIDQTIEDDLGYYTSHLYCSAYVTPEMQETFAAMGDSLIATFRTRIENNSWLTAATIEAAIEKLDYMAMDYGTSPVWPVTEPLTLEGKVLVNDVLEIKSARYTIIESLMGEPTHNYRPIIFMFSEIEGPYYPYLVNAFYSPELNSFFILPSLMMEPAYNPNSDEVELYATLSCIIGHEITHGYDKIGSMYDKIGQLKNWWTSTDLAKFLALNERRAANVSTFEVLPGLLANGTQTVTEDVADLGGVSIAYGMWCNMLAERGVQGDELKEQKRAFFLNYAKIFFDQYPESYLRKLAAEDPHSPGHIRINSVVQHFDDWYEIFDVKEGDLLYLAPEERITIW